MLSVQERLRKYLTEEIRRIEHIKSKDLVLTVPPSHMYIEATNACNHDCIMCVPKNVRGKIGFLNISIWKLIIQEMSKQNIMTPCTLIGRGEPLINRSLEDIIQLGTDANVPCYIITNGSLLTTERATSLLEAGVKKIQISLHAHSAEVHRKITRSKSDYENICENIRNLMALIRRKNYHCHVVVMATEMEINQHQMKEFHDYWSKIVDRCFVTKLYSILNQSRCAEEAREKRFASKKVMHPGCTHPFCFMTIRHDGEMTPCGFDFEGKLTIGNIHEFNYDIMKAFNSKIMIKLRNAMFNREFSFCKAHGYNCESCEYVHAPDTFRGLDSHISNLPELFSRNFAGALI